jgi:SAM-dependent methyltransferase
MHKEEKSENNERLVCLFCQGGFIRLDNNKVKCEKCEKEYNISEYGFIGYNDEQFDNDTTTAKYVEQQISCNEIVYKNYVKPLLFEEKTEKTLDVGCGSGIMVCLMREDGFEAYGIDLPNLAKFWQENNNDPQNFVSCSATDMPFPDDYFDLIYSFSVIEHIGTELGHCTLSENYEKERQNFVNELLRVTKKNGRILISCPNKTFPVDILHGPTDEMSPRTKINALRDFIFKYTGLNVHSTWGKHQLLSYPELEELFIAKGGAESLEALPLKDHFCFLSFENGLFNRTLKNLMKFYFNNLPIFLRTSFLNPYVIAQIRK